MIVITVAFFAAAMIGLWWYDGRSGVLDALARQALGA